MNTSETPNLPSEKALLRKELIQRATSILAREMEKLNPLTRNLVLAHFENPHLTQTELAVKFGCSKNWVNQLLNSNRVIQLFKALGKRKLEKLVPHGAEVFARLVAPDAVEKNPAEARKAAETILREAKVLGTPELRVINQFENMSHSDLRRFLQDTTVLPEPAIDAELVQDEPSDGGLAA